MVTRRRAPRGSVRCVAAAIVIVMMSWSLAEVRAATPTDGCCAKCIGKTADKPYTYDPLVYEQCNAAKGVCCFNCNSDTASQPTVENGVFGSDGVTPEVKAGEWIQLTWSNIARVTYETYQVNQNKTSTVRNGSTEAKEDQDVFFICAKTQGKVTVRGWGSDPCTTATTEYTIVVLAGSGNGTCADRTPTAPTSTKSASTSASKSASASSAADEDPDIAQCNAQRASVVEVDGKKTCVCAAEWTGPPECGGYPWWKTAATIGGGIAAVLSIVVSVKAFMNSRKAKKAEQEEMAKGEAVLGEESITIAGAPVMSNRSSNPAYQEPPVSTKAQDRKEYSL